MPTLTGLAPDPRQPGYRLVEVDRGRFASLPGAALEPLDLRLGAAIASAVLERLRELADIEAAERAALRALARRAHARRDLQRRLGKKQHPPRAVDAALERLVARGLLDDRRYAEQYAAVRAARGRGPGRLIQDLLAQGVERRIAEEAVRHALDEEGIDPTVEARAVAVKRVRQLGDLPSPIRKRRLLAFLVRRGYTGAMVKELVEELCGA
ncbi:MAG TPA: regulatory protein RecX [Gemmatimonadales bacterium]|nr:regulatory protein RecX [Gemmatimonadales bacterium]